jgi:LuxR family maltose regulon positive regulatory protein
MSAPLLTTKITLPPLRSNLVTRPRLIERLEAGWQQGRGVTLVAAPAGYGKTTLLRSWVEPHASRAAWLVRAAWVALDADDNRPALLVLRVAALQTLNGRPRVVDATSPGVARRRCTEATGSPPAWRR